MHYEYRQSSNFNQKASLEFEKVANSIFSEYDLTASQYRIIKFLYESELRTARVVDLEKHYSMTHSTMLSLLGQLEKKGFIKRVVNLDDARGKLVVLTEKADAMQNEIEALRDAIEKKLMRLTAEETVQLVGLLNKLLGLDQ